MDLPHLSACLAETTRRRIVPGWLWALLSRHNFASGRPKHTFEQLQDTDEVAACKTKLAAVAGNGRVRARPK